MNIYEGKFIKKKKVGGEAERLSHQNSSQKFPKHSVVPFSTRPQSGRRVYRLEPPIWSQPVCPFERQTGSLCDPRTPPDSHNCVMEVFLNCNLITILNALNSIMMGNKQEEFWGGG